MEIESTTSIHLFLPLAPGESQIQFFQFTDKTKKLNKYVVTIFFFLSLNHEYYGTHRNYQFFRVFLHSEAQIILYFFFVIV
jgi:hypothetical protein